MKVTCKILSVTRYVPSPKCFRSGETLVCFKLLLDALSSQGICYIFIGNFSQDFLTPKKYVNMCEKDVVSLK